MNYNRPPSPDDTTAPQAPLTANARLDGARNQFVAKGEGVDHYATEFKGDAVPIAGMLRSEFEDIDALSEGGRGIERAAGDVRGVYTDMLVETVDEHNQPAERFLLSRTSPNSVESAKDQTFTITRLDNDGQTISYSVPLTSQELAGVVVNKGEALKLAPNPRTGKGKQTRGVVSRVSAFKMDEIDESGQVVPNGRVASDSPIRKQNQKWGNGGERPLDQQVHEALEIVKRRETIAPAVGNLSVRATVEMNAEAQKQEDYDRAKGMLTLALNRYRGQDPSRDARLQNVLTAAEKGNTWGLEQIVKIQAAAQRLRNEAIAKGEKPLTDADIVARYQQVIRKYAHLSPAELQKPENNQIREQLQRAALIQDLKGIPHI